MVVVLVTDTFNTSNDETTISVKHLAEGLSRRGHKIRVITCGHPSKSGVDQDTGFEMLYVAELKGPIVSWFAQRQNTLFAKPIHAIIKKAISGADVVHIFQPWPLGSAAQRVARRLNVPVVATFQMQPESIACNLGLSWFPPAVHMIYLLLNLFFYRKFHHIHCPSRIIAAQLRSYGYKAWLHVIPDSVHQIPLPERSIRKMERIYIDLSAQKKNEHVQGSLFKFFSYLFYLGFAIPLMYFWMRFVLGAKIIGTKSLRKLGSAVTVCNHVHKLDCVLVALALFPRKAIFPTLPKNVRTLWPGKVVRVLGGVVLPENTMELKTFFDEMELLLMKNSIVHLFPEGEMKPYDTGLRDFKKGAFYLAARAQVPIVPMAISFKPPQGLRGIIGRKPVMILHIGTPIDPVAVDTEKDIRLRMKATLQQMNGFMSSSTQSSSEDSLPLRT